MESLSDREVSRGTVALMATATGVVIANLYCAQPLADTLAIAMRVPVGSVGVVLTLLQLGFAVGLATLVPLGDLLERRRLLVVLLSVCVLGMAGFAVAPSLAVLEVAAVFVGGTAVAAQIIVPFAAHLAGPHEQGRVVGTVMSGLLLGILVSRTAAGLIAEFAGWRAVFGVGAVATAVVGVLLYRSLPRIAPGTSLSYPRLLASVLTLVREEPVLRLRMLYGALVFASFSAFWSTAAFLLARPPYSFSEAGIGAFALVGVAGAIAARVAGRLTDRGFARQATGAFLAVTALSYVLIAFGVTQVVALVLGVLLMDLGAQGAHLSNQGVIYRLRPGAHSRVNTAYMTSYFIAGATGSGLASILVYPNFGWPGVCVLGAAFPTIGFLVWCAELRPARKRQCMHQLPNGEP